MVSVTSGVSGTMIYVRCSDGAVYPCHTVTCAPFRVTPLLRSGGWRLDHFDNVESHSLARLRRIHYTMARGAHAAAILGPELYSRLPNTRVLLVGAGGIGCELCKSSPLHSLRDDILLDSIRIPMGADVLAWITSKECGHDRVWRYHSPGPRHYRPVES